MPMPPKKHSSEILTQLGAVDTTPREIKRVDHLDVKCSGFNGKPCNVVGQARFGNLAETLKNHGYGWHCSDCRKAALSNYSKARVGSANHFFGKTHSDDTKKALSKSASSRLSKMDPNLRKSIAKQAFDASIEKYGTNVMNVLEIRQKHHDSTHTDEFIENARILTTQRMSTEEARNKISEDSKAFWTSSDGTALKAEKSKEWTEQWNAPGGLLYTKRIRNLKANWAQNKPAILEKFQKTILSKYGVDNPMKDPGIRRKSFANKEMSKPEKVINEFLKNRGFNYLYEHPLEDGGKFWDFVVFDTSNLPVLVIEIDGEYFHSLLSDPYSTHTKGHKDAQRFAAVPSGVKYLQVDSKRAKEAVPEISRLLGIDYDTWIKELYINCLTSPFPYPSYDDERMRKDWQRLCLLQKYSKDHMPANSLMTHFHKSIYRCRVGNTPSPVEAWSTPELLLKCIQNRFIYKSSLSAVNVARGFEKNGIAKRVSVFQPALARHLLQKFAPDSKSVVDPFSGFSGRMLGSLSLDKFYTGYDIRQETVHESAQVLEFLNLSANLKTSSIEEVVDNNHYSVLLTSPPYGSKEKWSNELTQDADYYIDLCLRKFDCDVYLFVVDKTSKYKAFVVDAVVNESHFNKNVEIVISIPREAVDKLPVSDFSVQKRADSEFSLFLNKMVSDKSKPSEVVRDLKVRKVRLKTNTQIQEAKDRAIRNGKTRIKYSPEDIQRVVAASGAVIESGDLSSPTNVIHVVWPDNAKRKIRIRRFMSKNILLRPKTGNENPNHIRHQAALKELGLEVEIIAPKRAKISYRGKTWEQIWVNAVDRCCSLQMKKIDTGLRIEELMASGLSLNKACKAVGVPPVTYYRRLKMGIPPSDAAQTIRNMEELLKIPHAIYRKKLPGTSSFPDIRIESKKLIIEVDGLHWHTEDKRPKNYHYDRADIYKKAGYALLAFSEFEVKERPDIVWSMINHRMGKTANSAGARKCELAHISPKEASIFFNENHLKGAGSGKCFALKFNDEIVAAIRWQMPAPDTVNISRFATKINWSVPGAYSKLLKTIPDNLKVINFVDRRHGLGEHLLSKGFEQVSIHVGFEWTDGYNAFNRRTYLASSGLNVGMKRFWDYGQIKFTRYPVNT